MPVSFNEIMSFKKFRAFNEKISEMLLVQKCLTLLLIFTLFQGCLPEQQVRTLEDTTVGNSTNFGDDNNSDLVDPSTNILTGGIGNVNFFQQGSTQTTTTLSLFADFNDSFIMRGDNLHNYLKEISPEVSSLCMIFEYSQTTALGKPLLALGARIRFFTNQELGGREYFLQMDPNNANINSADCLTINLTNAILSKYGTSDIAYTIDDVCTDCSLNKTSEDLTVFNQNGVVINEILLGNLALGIIPKIGTSNSVNQDDLCSTDSACKLQGYNCCITGQCVNHGEVKAGVNTSSTDYQNALQQILIRPETIKNYQEFFYVCNEFIPEDPDNTGDDPNLDPVQQADDLFSELSDLYNCLNPIIDEFSICTYAEQIDINNIGSGGNNFVVRNDDLTFKRLNTSLTYNNIVNIDYAGETLFQDKLYSSDTLIPADSSVTFVGGPNDSRFTAESVLIDKAIGIDAPNDIAKVRYRVDGTCERIGTSLAKCTKYYVQGQNSSPVRSSDHQSGNQIFKLPPYANLGFNVIVEVGGLRIAPGVDTWETEVLSGVNTNIATNKQVRFTGMSIQDAQTVNITYYVSDNVDALMSSRDIAQAALNEHCHCDAELGCNLLPVYTVLNGENKLTSYECLYPEPDVPPMPLQETIYVSAKSVAHRYYDENGVHFEYNLIGQGGAQEGNKFEYTSNNILKPNNIDQYIGFNEIYGSFSRTESSAMPAFVLDVERGKNYDLFVDEGAFSTCLNCGVDPYSGVQKLFPNSFLHNGGGYLPDVVESRRRDNRGSFGSDEMRFGRACFVPATMIPWTHSTGSTVQTQRQSRLSAQHFLFANGYNRDWYGFDYGSLIASYDGVKWFSVGNQRRIQAKSNKIYFAINAYYGDLTVNNTYKVTVSETSAILNSGSAVTHDTESDGAQCQVSHFCESDNDCITQLGYDYTCQNISSLKSPWPLFDANGNEIIGETNLFLSTIVGGTNGQVRRCVYRGKGSVCEENLNTITSANSYSSTNTIAFHACSPNTYCESLNESQFNTKISRYADTPATQNNKTYITNDPEQGATDTYGLAARYIGRPYKYYGDEATPSDVLSALNANNVRALCIPGRSPESSSTIADLNNSMTTREADSMFGIGRTMTSSTLQDNAYYSACPAVDDDGEYVHNQSDRLPASTTSHAADSINSFTVAQNISSNLMDISIFDELQLFNDDAANATKLGYSKNTCMRSAGSRCFSDLDCSPNRFITNQVKTLTEFGNFNEGEQEFWQQELTCGYAAKRYPNNSIYPDPLYDVTQHKCCMEPDKVFTYKSQPHLNSDFDVIENYNATDPENSTILIAGVNQDINSERRYSRNNIIYDKVKNEPDKYFPLYTASPRPSTPLEIADNGSPVLTQYNTLHLHNQRMCCSGHWVRSFASGTNANGGGHTFAPTKAQNIPTSTYRSLSWFEQNTSAEEDTLAQAFTCTISNYVTPQCEVKTVIEGSQEEELYLGFFSKLELIGIPQVLIETNEDVFREIGDTTLDTGNNIDNPTYVFEDQESTEGNKLPPYNTIKDVLHDLDNDGSIDGIVDVELGGKKYYSAASYDNFQMGFNQLKKVFSEDEFNCCLPTGFEITDLTIPDSACCTGKLRAFGEASNVCCLEDFTDVSVYTNRYVSSEGASFNGQEISEVDIDPLSGYIKPEVVLEMAGTMCCSGVATRGVALNEYFIPIDFTNVSPEQTKRRRWVYSSTIDNADEVGGGYTLYNDGLKFNNHIYCAPQSFADGGGSGGGGSSTIEN